MAEACEYWKCYDDDGTPGKRTRLPCCVRRLVEHPVEGAAKGAGILDAEASCLFSARRKGR
jgi:hypothetical protein